MVLVDSSLLSADSLARALIILAVGLLLLFSSIITICILMSNENLRNVMSGYLTSLALGDLLSALLIVPLSIYSALTPNWHFRGDNSLLCKTASYLQIVLISSTIYTFAWIGVDRYSAFMKPSRYEVEHTLTRCKCWIAFSWITAVLLACPMIVAKMEVNYNHDFELCVLNWSTTVAYSATLAVLVLLPTTCTIIFTCGSIFAAMSKPEELEDSQKSIVETDENFVVTLFVLISFVLAWLPIIVIQILPAYLIHPADSATMKFAFMWLAIGGSSTKLLIYTFTNREFRHSFCWACVGNLSGNNNHTELLNTTRLEVNAGLEPCERSLMQIGGNTENAAYIANNSNCHYNYTNNNVDYNSGNVTQQSQPQQFLLNNEIARRSSASCCCRVLPKSTTSSPIMATSLVANIPEYGSFARSPITYY